ncbi:hypothetical protein [Cylindrospermum sp. FACHB-282]|uniref:hypothetical protein n=1 Tax=Cylindrospermum sp. FACHB-282 TaxID=2692794 RepID=UPI0016844A78|nr:hypothetical protein [Cylindrospermum sp. FACHB-282]MBD2386002.1 hypothetical protein [Cylindrospermum sp. FACHB-282]
MEQAETQHLKQLLELRSKISELQAEVEGVMPGAINEAMKILSDHKGKNQVAYQNGTSKIVMVFKKQFPTPQTDLKLSRLDSDIMAAAAKIANDNAVEVQIIESEVQKHKDAIATLEVKRNKLLSNRYLTRLQNEYKKHREESVVQVPNLSVFL